MEAFVVALKVAGTTVAGLAVGYALGYVHALLVVPRHDVSWQSFASYLAGRWGTSILFVGLLSGLAVFVGGNITTFFLFAAVGLVADRVTHLTYASVTGRFEVPLGWGCFLTLTLPVIGGVLWAIGAWPFT